MNKRLNHIITLLITLIILSNPLYGFNACWFTESVGKSIEIGKKHPVISAVALTIAAYGIYSLFVSKKTLEVQNEQELSVTFKAPQYDIQNRLYKALLAMQFQENNHNALESFFDKLQQFKLELELEQYRSLTSIQEVKKRLAVLLESMNTYLSLADHKDSKDLYDRMLLNYALLVSFLLENNKTLIKTIQ